MTAIREHITKAADSAQFCWDDLHEAYLNASPLEMLMLEPLMEQSVILCQKLARLRDALPE